MLDGKRIGRRVEELLFDKTFTIEDGMGLLATFIANSGLIDPDVTFWLDTIADGRAR